VIARLATLIVGILPLGRLKPPLLNLAGHRVARDARIASCVLLCRRLCLGPGTRIGRFNLIATQRLLMREGAAIGAMNFLKGRASVWLAPGAEIGNRNKITRGHVPGVVPPSQLRLGALSKLTADHTVDLGDSVLIAGNTVLGGLSSQVWTHGFIHQPDNPERIYIRGKVLIGEGCFIGSRACISAGTVIGDHVSIGAQSSVAGRLTEPGVYVSQRLRHLEIDPVARVSELTPIRGAENAFVKAVAASPKGT